MNYPYQGFHTLIQQRHLMNLIDVYLISLGVFLLACIAVAVGFYSYIDNIKKASRKAKNKIVKI